MQPGNDDLIRREIAAEGDLRFEYAAHEMRMSHWVHQIRLVSLPAEQILFDLWGADAALWDSEGRFCGAGVVEITLRRYPDGSRLLRVRIDARNKTWHVLEGTLDALIEARLCKQLQPKAV